MAKFLARGVKDLLMTATHSAKEMDSLARRDISADYLLAECRVQRLAVSAGCKCPARVDWRQASVELETLGAVHLSRDQPVRRVQQRPPRPELGLCRIAIPSSGSFHDFAKFQDFGVLSRDSDFDVF